MSIEAKHQITTAMVRISKTNSTDWTRVNFEDQELSMTETALAKFPQLK
jgi:hypothetical protein